MAILKSVGSVSIFALKLHDGGLASIERIELAGKTHTSQ